jgi:hypothetical protein
MKYCSVLCQQRNMSQHNHHFGTFKNLPQRPSPQHSRAIYFPHDRGKARFIWIKSSGSRDYHSIDYEKLVPYVSRSPLGSILLDAHKALNRDYKKFMVV